MNGRAAGATSPKACTCAITSWRKRRSYSATASKSMSSRCARICASASSGIATPSSLLGLREREPEPAPEPVPLARRPQLEHRARGVALGERRRVAVVRGDGGHGSRISRREGGDDRSLALARGVGKCRGRQIGAMRGLARALSSRRKLSTPRSVSGWTSRRAERRQVDDGRIRARVGAGGERSPRRPASPRRCRTPRGRDRTRRGSVEHEACCPGPSASSWSTGTMTSDAPAFAASSACAALNTSVAATRTPSPTAGGSRRRRRRPAAPARRVVRDGCASSRPSR